ncbi:MAG: hypothetical protein AUH11_03760 [Acidobacteria bacterium 13_2_20CM_57_17]|nr:MAG: hypothetical protein AUH11_03760 [Acidobacteria bacterium 13_2_20CM_57_17]
MRDAGTEQNSHVRGARIQIFVRVSCIDHGPQICLRGQDTGSALSATGVHAIALPDSTQRVVFDKGAFFGESLAMPHWDNGYLLSRVVETYQAGEPNIRLYDRSGKKVREARIWFPESPRVVIYSATVTSDGRIIAAGNAQKSDGAAAPFIALTDLTGKVTNVIQTQGFVPANICRAPDGTIWSFGGTGYDTHSEPNPGDTLRHFDFQKGQIGSYLPRSSFPQHLHPGPEVSAEVRCGANEVVVYSRTARAYLEMTYADVAPRAYHAEPPYGLRLYGFTASGSKKAYGCFSHAGKGGLFYLSFNDVTSTVRWLPAEGTVGLSTRSGVITGLWGSEGDNLLVSRAEDSAGVVAIHWVAPADK